MIDKTSFDSKRFRLFVFGIVLGLTIYPASSQGETQAEWRPLINELKAKHPEIEARKRLWRSLKELPEAKMAWDDPIIKIGLLNAPVDTFDLDQEAMTQKVIGITQRMPSRAKREADAQAAEADAGIAKAKIGHLTANLAALLKKTIYKIAYFDSALKVLAKNETILEQFIRIANAKYSSGKGIQLNVIQAQVERSKLIDKRLSLIENRRRAVVQVNRLLGRDMIAGFSVNKSLLITPERLIFEKSWERVAHSSPELTIKKAQLIRARKGIKQAESLLGMNVTFSAQYGQREDGVSNRPDFMSATAAASVPLWKSSKQEKIIKSAKLKADEASFNLNNTRQKVKEALHQALISFETEKKIIDLYTTGVIPQSRQALESSMVAYQADKVDFLTMLTNELTLLKYELELENSLFRLRRLSAEVELLEGGIIGEEK